MTDRVIGEVIIGDNLWQRNGGVLGEPGHDADLIFGLDVGKVIACGAKDKLIVTARQLDGRKSDEINRMLLRCHLWIFDGSHSRQAQSLQKFVDGILRDWGREEVRWGTDVDRW